jgi:ADP-ribose pyrophosphatase
VELDPCPARLLARGGFLTVASRRVRTCFQGGGDTGWYRVESVHPPFLDAVVLCLHGPADQGPVVALRRGVRPAAALRALEPGLLASDGEELSGLMWELPAGGVEPQDLAPGGPGIWGRAAAEAWEEAGLAVEPAAFASLGPAPFSAPSFCPERLHYLAAEVDPAAAQEPPGDGHPMEQGAELRFLPLDQALAWCREGVIVDLKTEVGLNRLAQWLAGAASPSQRSEP